MAYEDDRSERDAQGGSFLMGLLAGTVLGAGLGMLFAPKSGTELRNQLSESAERLRTTAGDSYQQASEKVTEKVTQIVDRGRDVYDRARTAGTPETSGSKTILGAPANTPMSGGPMSGAGTGGHSSSRT